MAFGRRSRSLVTSSPSPGATISPAGRFWEALGDESSVLPLPATSRFQFIRFQEDRKNLGCPSNTEPAIEICPTFVLLLTGGGRMQKSPIRLCAVAAFQIFRSCPIETCIHIERWPLLVIATTHLVFGESTVHATEPSNRITAFSLLGTPQGEEELNCPLWVALMFGARRAQGLR